MTTLLKRVWISICLAGLVWLGASRAPAAEGDTPPAEPARSSAETAKPTEDLHQLRQENARLKEEIAVLRRENQQLRRLIVERADAASTNSPAARAENPKAAPASDGHWLSTGSNKRHNSSCRYFKNTEGRPCGVTDGTACKLCGG